jgi:uncharacterized protein
MGRVVHFEMPADDVERASDFYESVFGWKIRRWEGPIQYWLATTGDEADMGIDGAVARRTPPIERLVVTIGVGDLDDTVTKLVAAGGRALDEKQAVPGVGWHRYCEDTEGNVIGVLQPDESAK